MEITKDQQSIFDGLVLSDAGLSIAGKNARFSMTSKHRCFIEGTKNHLSSLSWGPINEADRCDKRTKKFYHSISIHSHVDEWLTSQYCRWYKNKIKIVPKDLEINYHSLLWWYLGDGHLRRRKSRPNYRRVELATDCFTKKECNDLINKLSIFLILISILSKIKFILVYFYRRNRIQFSHCYYRIFANHNFVSF